LADADHKQSGEIGRASDLVAIEHDRGLGLNGDPTQPGLSRQSYRARPDRRAVGADLLPGLLDLDEHATRPFPAKRPATVQQLVGALDRLDAEHEALLNDHRLPDVEGLPAFAPPPNEPWIYDGRVVVRFD